MKNEPSIIKELLCEYRDIILYIIVGAITTAINYISYLFFLNAAGLSNIVSSVISWFLSVTFSFIANKLIVFKSKSFMPLIFFKEAAEFFGCRIATGFLDLGIMYYGVDRMGANPAIWKLVSIVSSVILNYAASKLIIFKKHK